MYCKRKPFLPTNAERWDSLREGASSPVGWVVI
jgi:hypothetical protein